MRESAKTKLLLLIGKWDLGLIGGGFTVSIAIRITATGVLIVVVIGRVNGLLQTEGGQSCCATSPVTVAASEIV